MNNAFDILMRQQPNLLRLTALVLFFAMTTITLHAQDCSGIPTAGSITGSNMVCPTNESTFTLQGASAENGISYQWQSSTNGTTWSNIANATSTVYKFTPPAAFIIQYLRVAVTCNQSSQTVTTDAFKLSPMDISGYNPLPFTENFEGGWAHICVGGQLPQPSGPFAWTNVPISGNNSWRREDDGTSADWSQADFGAYSPGGADGSNHSARFHSSYASKTIDNGMNLHINCATALATKKLSFDYINIDGTDSLQILLSTDGGTSFTRIAAFTTAGAWTNKSVIFNSMSASTILRFKAYADNENSDIGMDNVSVKEVVVCDGMPVIGNIIPNNNSICHNNAVHITLASLPAIEDGIVYQWQSSTDNINWADIKDSTGTTLTSVINETTYFRLLVTCTTGNQTATSNVVNIMLAATPMNGTYTINKATPTGGRNFASFTDAAAALRCAGVDGAVTFDVAAGSGSYNEQLILDSTSGASATNTITFNGNKNTIHFSSHDGNEMAVIKLRNADYISVNDLTIDGRRADGDITAAYGIGVQLLKDADNNNFKNCTIIVDSNDISQGTYYGVVIGGSDDDVVSNATANCDNNVFDHDSIMGGYMAIALNNDDNGTCDKNVFTNNTISSFNFKGIAVQYSSNTIIENNTFNCTVRKVSTSFLCIDLESTCSNTLISKNSFTNPYDGHPDGQYLSFYGIVDNGSSTGTRIVNNRLYNIGMGESITGIMTGVYDALIYHNTIDIDYSNQTTTDIVNGIRTTGGLNGAVIKNNIVTIHNNGASPSFSMMSYGDKMNADYNDYFSDGSGTTYIGSIAGNNYKTLDAWQAIISGETNTKTIDPVYEDAATGNLKPSARAIDNMGAPLGVTTDILNAPRSASTPDMGAFEFKACTPIRGLYTINAKATPGTDRTFLSFTAANDALKCGIDSAVIFNVVPGTYVYNEQLNMTAVDGSSAANTITFKGNGDTIRYSSKDINNKAVIKLSGTQYVIFDSLVVDATSPNEIDFDDRWGHGFQIVDGASHNIIRKSTILADTTQNHYWTIGRPAEKLCISFTQDNFADPLLTDYNLVDSCVMIGGFSGIKLTGKAIGNTFSHNKLINFHRVGIEVNGNLSHDGDIVDSLLIEKNELFYTANFGTKDNLNFGGTGDGIIVREADHVIISKNIVHDLHGISSMGIGTDYYVANVTITNNLIYNFGPYPTEPESMTWQTGINTQSVGKSIVEHNTVAFTNATKDKSSQIVGFLTTGSFPNITDINTTFKNNLISIRGDGVALAIGVITSKNDFAVYHFNHNDYFLENNDHTFTGRYYTVPDFASLEDWKKAIGNDTNSISIDPVFKDPANGDYHPTSKLFDDKGEPVGILTDLDEVTRSTTKPDIGAFEFKSCLPDFAKFSASSYQPCIGENVSFKSTDTLSDGSNVTIWAWDFGNNNTSTISNPTITYSSEGKYSVKLSATTDNGCTDDTTQTITVMDCDKQLYIPNAFSPNNDGVNDMLLVYGNGIKEMTLMIYNQWGEKLFESHNTATGWDGKQNGKLQPSGVYMYVCKVTMTDGKEIVKKGAINLIR